MKEKLIELMENVIYLCILVCKHYNLVLFLIIMKFIKELMKI